MLNTYFAPGRINLIGEHLDYNGGLVLPAAITLGISATFKPNDSGQILLTTDGNNKQTTVELQINAISYEAANDWCNYPMGVIRQLLKEGFALPSGHIHYSSTLPQGSGLSSSAAIEVLTAWLLLSEIDQQPDKVWLANVCRQVENEFIGVQCGIMDQYAVALGQKDHAILIDCAALTHEYIPIELGPYELMVLNTNKPRSLVHSKYNERKAECEAALKQINATNSFAHLCEATPLHLQLINDDTLYKRAKHVVTEMLRVKESVKALDFNDLSTFGRLMNASHDSLQNDYEVSGKELDTLVHTARTLKGCLGARMTGAGFGGCAIAIVHQQHIHEFTDTVSNVYEQNIGYAPDIYPCRIGDGVHRITD